MAQKVQYLLIDDVDGTEAVETVSFGLDGVSYEIDLSAEHAAALRESLAEWLGHARKTGGRAARGRGRAAKPNAGETGRIREWAKANGYTVSERGRISAEIKEAWAAAN